MEAGEVDERSVVQCQRVTEFVVLNFVFGTWVRLCSNSVRGELCKAVGDVSVGAETTELMLHNAKSYRST